MQFEERHAAGSKQRVPGVLFQHREAHGIAIEPGDAIEIAYREADRADMQRGPAGEGRGRRWVGCVHDAYIGFFTAYRNLGSPRVIT